MLVIHRTPSFARSIEVFEPDVRYAVKRNERRLEPLGRWDSRLFARRVGGGGGLDVPCPPQVCKGAGPAGYG